VPKPLLTLPEEGIPRLGWERANECQVREMVKGQGRELGAHACFSQPAMWLGRAFGRGPWEKLRNERADRTKRYGFKGPLLSIKKEEGRRGAN